MSTDIYYFTGTGNSLVVARALAEKTNGRLVPIASLAGEETVAADADKIGIVFPVYYADIPVIVGRFAAKLAGIGGRYVFAVCTYGGGTGASLQHLRRIIESRGGRLSAWYGVHMPQNAFYKSWENKTGIYAQSRRKIEIIAGRVNRGQEGALLSDRLARALLYPIELITRATFRRYLTGKAGSSDLPNEELIRLLDKGFEAGANCTGCGTCAQVCPVDNIRMVEGRPVWSNRCENCLACYHWCPHEAIGGGIAPAKNHHYRHPKVHVADIVRQKRAGTEN